MFPTSLICVRDFLEEKTISHRSIVPGFMYCVACGVASWWDQQVWNVIQWMQAWTSSIQRPNGARNFQGLEGGHSSGWRKWSLQARGEGQVAQYEGFAGRKWQGSMQRLCQPGHMKTVRLPLRAKNYQMYHGLVAWQGVGLGKCIWVHCGKWSGQGQVWASWQLGQN